MLALALLSCFPVLPLAAQEQLYRGEHLAMGTTWTIVLYARDADTGQAAIDAAWDESHRRSAEQLQA